MAAFPREPFTLPHPNRTPQGKAVHAPVFRRPAGLESRIPRTGGSTLGGPYAKLPCIQWMRICSVLNNRNPNWMRRNNR